MGRLTYVCSTCSEHFTRKYSGTRHNNNIHRGGAEIVRLLDYMVGRVSGLYLASHPSRYRHEQKYKFAPATVADTVGNTFQPRYGPQQAPRDNIHKDSTNPIFRSAYTADDQIYGTRISPGTKLKIEELKTLLAKYQAYFHDVNVIFRWAVSWSNKGDDNFLDEKLAQLRNMDKRRTSPDMR